MTFKIKLGMLALLLTPLIGCPMSPRRACRQGLTQGCKKARKCDRASFDRLFDGISDCVKQAERLLDCDAVDKELMCDGQPENYDAWAAGACVRRGAAAACDDNSVPKACDEICGP